MRHFFLNNYDIKNIVYNGRFRVQFEIHNNIAATASSDRTYNICF